jgi:hypothetical protein
MKSGENGNEKIWREENNNEKVASAAAAAASANIWHGINKT